MTEALLSHFGGPQTRDQLIAAEPARQLAATLNLDPAPLQDGAALPPLWHWLYFLDQSRLDQAGPDGHQLAGGLPADQLLPRRMFAGGRYRFGAPLRIGAPAHRVAAYHSVQEKIGSAGRLVFVTQRVTIVQEGQVCVEEERDLVFRAAGAPIAPVQPQPFLPAAAGERVVNIEPDPVLLFRFSALTFNSHRIHYDAPYAQAVEGYPGLVVHGPLTALLLASFLIGGPARGRFSFRAEAPLFCDQPFQLRQTPSPDPQQAVALRCDGQVAMRASFDTTTDPSHSMWTA